MVKEGEYKYKGNLYIFPKLILLKSQYKLRINLIQV
jgi:hypothetical protein